MENKKIKTFEDLKVYQMAREFRRKVEKLIKKLPVEEKFSLISQMRKAKLSVTNT
jgi:four helix bundle protein